MFKLIVDNLTKEQAEALASLFEREIDKGELANVKVSIVASNGKPKTFDY